MCVEYCYCFKKLVVLEEYATSKRADKGTTLNTEKESTPASQIFRTGTTPSTKNKTLILNTGKESTPTSQIFRTGTALSTKSKTLILC